MLSDLPGEFLQFWEAVQGAVVDHVSDNVGQFDDEVLGEILTRVWERRGKYDSGKTGIMRWVKRQALDTAVMHNRKNERFDALAELSGRNYVQDHPGEVASYRDPSDAPAKGSTDLRDGGQSVEDIIVGCETYGEFLGALLAMPDRRALSLVYRYLEGDSLEEIADRMDVSVSAVKYLLRYGRETLAGKMASHGVVAPSGTLPLVSQQYVADGRLITGRGTVDYKRCGPQDTETVTVRQL